MTEPWPVTSLRTATASPCLDASRVYHAARKGRIPRPVLVPSFPPAADPPLPAVGGPCSDDDESESVEAEVRRELDMLPESKSMPGQAAACLRLARLMDGGARTAPQQPAAAAQLRLSLDAIRARVDESKPTRLALLPGAVIPRNP